MKVFISWSGDKSKAAAEALRDWLPLVIQSVIPWMSRKDIAAGASWNKALAKELGETKYGIICLTKMNLNEPWINFETGAISKTINDDAFVCPYLIDLEPGQIPPGPLVQFQAKKADQDQTFELLQGINNAMPEKEKKVPEINLERLFSKLWPDLKQKLDELPQDEGGEAPLRQTEDMVAEILEIVREINRPRGLFSQLSSDFQYTLPATVSLKSPGLSGALDDIRVVLSSTASPSPSESVSPSASTSPSVSVKQVKTKAPQDPEAK